MATCPATTCPPVGNAFTAGEFALTDGAGVDVCANIDGEESIASAEIANANVLAEMASAKKFFFEIISVGSDPSPRCFCTVLIYQS